jgi:hypothetical protein
VLRNDDGHIWEVGMVNGMREGWVYEDLPGGGLLGYPGTARPSIQWNHVDGPLLHLRNGELHWLTWRERFRSWMGYDDAESLEAKHRPHLAQPPEFGGIDRAPSPWWKS